MEQETDTLVHIEMDVNAATLPAMAVWLQGRGDDVAASAARALIGSQRVTPELIIAWLESEFSSADNVQGTIVDETRERRRDYWHVVTSSILNTPWGMLTICQHRDTPPETPGCSFMTGRRTAWARGYIGDIEILIYANGDMGYGWRREE